MKHPSKKLLLLGEIGVGKTSLVRRLVHGTMAADYMATMGVDLYRYEIGGIGAENKQTLELVIWDLDGNLGTNVFRHVYARGASGAMIIGDVMRRSTLEHMVTLAHGFQDAMPGREFSFVVNKVDLVEKRDLEALPEALRSTRHPLVWTSALTSENVKPAFGQTADAILRRET